MGTSEIDVSRDQDMDRLGLAGMQISSIAQHEIEAQLREIARRLDELAAQTPEMSGMDLAYDRGNVSREDWEAADAAAKASVESQQAEVAKIDELRSHHPAEVDAYLDMLCARLAQQLEDVGGRLDGNSDPESDSKLRFKHALLPDLIACLTAWRARSPSPHSFVWAWRIVFSTMDECATLLR
jgi:hypothetical protein